MKKKSPPSVVTPVREPTEDEIRDYAYHLYQQSGCVPDRDLENWLEAKACLEAAIPKQHTHTRLHRLRHPEQTTPITVVAIETETDSLLGPLPGAEATVERVVLVGGVPRK